MKQAFVIFQLLCFCVYAFTHKTHWCYHVGSHERFHGDCQWEIKSLGLDKDKTSKHLLPQRYYCLDVHKAEVLKKGNTPLPSPHFDLHIIAPTCFALKLTLETGDSSDWKITDTPIRAGPDLLANSLRGPPLV